MKFGVTKYVGKINARCGMCHDTSYNDKYRWIGYITKDELDICHKCAQREVGKKLWKKRSQQIKKS